MSGNAPRPSHVLGVDGGNTKTIAAVATLGGQVAGVGRSGSSDIYARASPEAAIEEIARAVEDAFAQAGIGADGLAASAFSLAGADWPEDFELLERGLAARLGLRRPLVVNDALGALRSGASDWVGLSVACGTYNAIGARSRDGRVFHLGAWPDAAGGQELAREALNAVYRQGLGLGPPTALTPAVLATFGVPDSIELLHAFMRRENRIPGRELRRLPPIVLDAADAGDAVARALVERAGAVLGAQARAAAGRVGLPVRGATVVVTGGVMEHPSTLLADAVMRELPGAAMVRPAAPPVVGAMLLALDRLGVVAEAEALGEGYRARTAT